MSKLHLPPHFPQVQHGSRRTAEKWTRCFGLLFSWFEVAYCLGEQDDQDLHPFTSYIRWQSGGQNIDHDGSDETGLTMADCTKTVCWLDISYVVFMFCSLNDSFRNGIAGVALTRKCWHGLKKLRPCPLFGFQTSNINPTRVMYFTHSLKWT